MDTSVTLPDKVGVRERVALGKIIFHRSPSAIREAYRQAVLDRCVEDDIFFTNMFGYAYDPREGAPMINVPLLLYDYQEELIHWYNERLRNKEDALVPKSRFMGVTWVTLWWSLHKFLYRPGTQGLIGSRKEDLVDNWTLDSHFGKLQYAIEQLPHWMLPDGFSIAEHRAKLKLTNPDNGNVIIGESANAQFSRQGRYTYVLFDEADFWPDLQASFRAAGMATQTRILVSTARGLHYFYDLIESKKYPTKRLHVDSHPIMSTEEWKAWARGRMSPEDYAQEVDINFHRSQRGRVYPNAQNLLLGDFPHVRGWGLYTSTDAGIADDTAIIWVSQNPTSGKLRIIDCYSNNNKPIDFYFPFYLGYIPEGNDYDYSDEELAKIASHSQLRLATHFADPDILKRSLQTGVSLVDLFREQHIIMTTNSKQNDFLTRKSLTDKLIQNIEGVNTPECAEFTRAIINARFPDRKVYSESTQEIIKPVHDWTEAYRSALEFLAVNLPPFEYTMHTRPAPARKQMRYDRVA